MNHICVNGKFHLENEPILFASNRSFRYGHGLFETMKWIKGNIQLEDFHFSRFFDGLDLLKFQIPLHFTAGRIKEEIKMLCKKNKSPDLARIRLSVFPGNGGLYDDDTSLQYIIESWLLPESVNKFNENGLDIGLYPDARKSFDKFSNLKSASFLPYSLAAAYAKENKWNDCIILNQENRIADTTIANIFIVKGDNILTPALSEACVSGTIRKYLLEKLKGRNIPVQETTLSSEDIESADEVFLTNAIKGIRWVKSFNDSRYGCEKTINIFNDFIKTIPA